MVICWHDLVLGWGLLRLHLFVKVHSICPVRKLLSLGIMAAATLLLRQRPEELIIKQMGVTERVE